MDTNILVRRPSKINNIPVFTWIRKRTHQEIWAKSALNGDNFKFVNTTRYLVNCSRRRAEGDRLHPKKYTNKDLFDHCLGNTTLHCTADYRHPESLICIDIDCHDRGTYDGAVALARALADQWPGLYWQSSTNGRGVHAYVVIVNDKGIDLDPYLNSLHTFLVWVLKRGKFDVEAVEVLGRGPRITWGDRRGVFASIKYGHAARMPTEMLERAEELMGTTRLTPGQLSALGMMARSNQPQTNNPPSSVLLNVPPCFNDAPSQFGEVDVDDIRQTWLPEKRNREWVFWLQSVAANGLTEEDSLDDVVLELARWLLHVEMFGEDVADVAEVIKTWIADKHNGYSTRINQGKQKEVDTHVDRIVTWASRNLEPGSAELFCRIRQKRDQGKYKTVVYLVPIMIGEHKEVEQPQADNPPYSVLLNVPPCFVLPTTIQSKLLAYVDRHNTTAKDKGTKKMNRLRGQYPLIEFARVVIGHLWQSRGSARIHRDQFANINDKHRAHEYKAALDAMGLIIQKGYCPGKASAMYVLPADVQEVLAAQHASSVRAG